MIDAGPSAKRPPHIWLEPAMPRLPLLSLTLPIVLVVAGCSRQSGGEAQQQASATPAASASDEAALNGTLDRSHAGEPLPNATIEGPNGIKLNLATLKGAPVLVNLWATWCAPCVKEMPTLDHLADEPGTPRILAVSEDLKGAASVNPFLAQHPFLHLQTWLDPETNLSLTMGGASGSATLPTTVLYDAQGKEVWRMVGGYDWSTDKAKALIGEAKGKA
ncbi:MAG: TlpA family protein disulfide reductase [Porphyrobacter sp.]|nr:TlpA family protein disulfide reductase [Porphyrobacter sp.]